MTSRPAQWTNWGRTFSYRPTRVVKPADAAEVVAVMATARRDGLRIKPLGSGHSFSPLTVTDGVQVRLDRLTGLVGTDIDSASGEGTVTVGAGTTLRALNAELARRGLGLANMGDIDVQTVSGQSPPAPTVQVGPPRACPRWLSAWRSRFRTVRWCDARQPTNPTCSVPAGSVSARSAL